MKKLMNYLMLSCQKASALLDKKDFFGLTRKEKVMLKMHTAMCDACTNYKKQSELIDKILHKHFHTITEEVNTIIENKELKAQIISKF